MIAKKSKAQRVASIPSQLRTGIIAVFVVFALMAIIAYYVVGNEWVAKIIMVISGIIAGVVGGYFYHLQIKE